MHITKALHAWSASHNFSEAVVHVEAGPFSASGALGSLLDNAL